MTDQPDHVVISYARFLEFAERRRRVARDLVRPQPPTTDADTAHVPNHPPAPAGRAWRHS